MTIETFLLIVKIIMALNGLIALLAFLFYKRRSTMIKLVGLSFLYEVMGYFGLIAFDAKGMQVNIAGNLQMLFYFPTITAVYYLQFQKRYGRTFLTIVILFLIFALINLFFVQKMNMNMYTAALINFVQIGYCIVYFYKLMIDMPAPYLQRLPMFWISTALLLQSAGAFFLHLFTAYLTKFFFDDVLIYWTFHDLLIIIQQVLIIIGVSVDLKNSVFSSRKGHTSINDLSMR